ncbi:uncharacterized protein FTOL_13397 [Fusarium torulosum]|uniref:Uncharacterized protein n=1 Tax=Fusarium torulosum TaxID=33205 RepID=A0AAE8SPT0_9HYPO|nr:uncharacterized protein FTOL_13397 [Fusarium torulosum]
MHAIDDWFKFVASTRWITPGIGGSGGVKGIKEAGFLPNPVFNPLWRLRMVNVFPIGPFSVEKKMFRSPDPFPILEAGAGVATADGEVGNDAE